MKNYPYPVCRAYDEEYGCYDGFGCRNELHICPLDMFLESLKRIDLPLYLIVLGYMDGESDKFYRAKEDIVRQAIPHETGRRIIRELITGRGE